MFDIGYFMERAYWTAGDYREEELRKHVHEGEPVPWVKSMGFQSSLNIKAGTYKVKSLFDVEPCTARSPGDVKRPKKMLAVSKGGQWCYRERVLPAGEILATYSGNRRGVIRFEDEVVIPMIHQKRGDHWGSDPWMSYTPMEFFTGRGAIRAARGHTIVAGLGMGYYLEEICKKRTVEKVTLIEISQDIVDFIMPRLDLNGVEVEVVIGDANELLFNREADVAVVDIYPRYGNNGHMLQHYAKKRRKEWKIGKLWIWGSCSLG
jgi:hypothetical protein